MRKNQQKANAAANLVCHALVLRRVPQYLERNMPNKIQDLHTVDENSFPYIYEQNAAVSLKSSEGLVRVNIYRPKNSNQEKVPVLVTYGP